MDTPDPQLNPAGLARNARRSPSRVRRWMTGSLALVMASLAGQAAASPAPSERRGISRASPYGLVETVRRIEQAAVAHGMPVLARVDRSSHSSRQWVIVLASSEGGTPVMTDPRGAVPAVPLSVLVQEGPQGEAWVRLPPMDLAMADGADSDWPDSVVDELAGLPLLIDEALH